MSNPKLHRQRAVRLTTNAYGLLQQGLMAKWQADDQVGKLTREARADLLGLSVATADRVLKGQAVDRATLTLAFKNLDLDWQDTYCELAVKADRAVEEPVKLAAVPLRASPRFQAWWIAGIGLAACALTFLTFKLATQEPVKAAAQAPADVWKLKIERELSEVIRMYQTGQYANARNRLTAVISAARSLEAAGTLASSLRTAGDLATEQGDFGQAKDLYQEALNLRIVLTQEGQQVSLLETIGDTETKLGDYAEARISLTKAMEGFTEEKDASGVAMANRELGSLYFKTGDFDASESCFRAGLLAIRGHNQPEMEMDILARQALVWQRQGRVKDARAQLNSCLLFWTGRDHPRWIATTRCQLGSLEVEVGHIKAGTSLLELSEKGFEQVGDKAGAAEAMQRLNEARAANSTM